MTKEARFVPLDYTALAPELSLERSAAFAAEITKRRTVREFSAAPVERAIIENCIKAAGSAPSGANQQPWHFTAIGNPDTKRAIRLAAEEEERAFYAGKAGEEWLSALAPLGTDDQKPFLETAPWLIVVFAKRHGVDPETGKSFKHYYVNESVGIACGMLLTALHTSGLATLTHTPSPMGFLRDICKRPAHEKPMMIIVTGLPANNVLVPAISRKPVAEILEWIE